MPILNSNFKNNNKIGYLIIEQQAEEFINAEEVFDVKMLGFIENFFFYKKLNYPDNQ